MDKATVSQPEIVMAEELTKCIKGNLLSQARHLIKGVCFDARHIFKYSMSAMQARLFNMLFSRTYE